MDLVSMLQQALLQQQANQFSSKPFHDPGTARYVRYVQQVLLGDSFDDLANEERALNILQTSSCQRLVDELTGLISQAPDHHVPLKLSNVDFRRLLVEGANAVAAHEPGTVYRIVNTIQDMTKQRWECPSEMVAHLFAGALAAKLVGTGRQSTEILRTAPTPTGSKPSKVPNQKFHVSATTAYQFACQMILRHCENAERLHILDFGIDGGYQWRYVIQALADRPAGPPEYVRITGVDFPHVDNPGVKLTLEKYASSVGLTLVYSSVSSQAWESAKLLTLDSAEVLIVNCNLRMRQVVNSDMLLKRIAKLQPSMFLQCEFSANFTTPFFVSRFEEALRFFEACFCATSEWANLHELLQRQIMDVVACEAPHQEQRVMNYTVWDAKARRAGFLPMYVPEDIVDMVGACATHCNTDCSVRTCDQGWLLLSWKDVLLSGMCAWQPGSRWKVSDFQVKTSKHSRVLEYIQLNMKV